MKVARATFAVVVIAAGLAACTPPLPPEADPNGSLVSDSIAVLSVVPIEKGDSGSALIFINKSGHATRLQTDDTIGPAVVADDDSIYFSGTKNEYALTDGRLHSMPRHVDLHSQDALHVVQPDTRVGIFNEGGRVSGRHDGTQHRRGPTSDSRPAGHDGVRRQDIWPGGRHS
ncbi:hypothetical protein [Aeromicrobium sp. UC242_57]|uniref:hypothetical protein n=1 Tax=Aeromicrobium sp. UC242_57 TaxID=3374624 RepID=UPI00379F421B